MRCGLAVVAVAAGVMALPAAGGAARPAVPQGAGAAAAEQSGWRELFDGKDLAGWEHVGPGGFVVRDGLLVAKGGMGLLVWTGGPVGRCELRVVYRSRGRNENSGVFVRIPERPTEPWMPVRKGYEVQIDNEDDLWHRTGTLYSFTRAMASPGLPGPAWNTMVIRLDGRRTVVRVNGVLVTDFTEVPGWVPPARVHDYEPYPAAAGCRMDRVAEPWRGGVSRGGDAAVAGGAVTA